MFVFRTVGHRPWTIFLAEEISTEGEKKFTKETINEWFSNDLESVGQRFFFLSLLRAFYPSIGGRKYSFATKYRIDKFEENFGDLSAD